ncbi:MAG TPA: TetR/AcrR family transcriptional regulator [Nitrososphaerales archaeon]|nr:TetR/AcrR family transcriptional regulator [Nitrososphaerales archaeon]
MRDGRQKVTSAKILKAASDLFSEKGYANVSIRDICRATGTTAPVIYYYFGSKKGLFDAVAKKGISMGDFIEELLRTSETKNPRKAIGSFVAKYLSSFPEHSFYPGLYLRDSASLDRLSAEMASRDLERIREMAAGIIERGIRTGEFRRADPAAAADCLLGMLNRVIFQHIHFSKTSDKDSYSHFVTDFFFRAMEPKP